METLDKQMNKTVCINCTERTLVVFFIILVCLCCVVPVSMHYRFCLVTGLYCKMGDLSDFQRGKTVGAHLAGLSIIKIATLLCVSRAAVSNVMMEYTNHGKTSLAERNSGQNSKLSERDNHTMKRNVSKNHRTTAAQVTAELNSHLEDPVSTKIVR